MLPINDDSENSAAGNILQRFLSWTLNETNASINTDIIMEELISNSVSLTLNDTEFKTDY